MALFKILKGKSANLPANKVNGYCYVTTDEHKLYVDYTKDDGTLDRFALNAVSADQWKTARNLNGMVVNGTSNVVNYGTCSTAAATAAKVVSCSNFALITGAEITVKFTTTNTATNPTLNVNSTGAKAIHYRGSAISAGYLAANRTYTFRYNGSQYDLVGDLDTNTTYGSMSIDEGTTGTATTNRVLTATNLKGIINAHAPTKTGNGASGTWGINISGNAATATKLATARTISLTGSVTGSGSFDGSGNLNISTTTNHNHDSSYVKKSGDTMSGLLKAHGGISLNSSTAESTGLTYVLGIKAFADGGNIVWSSAENVSVGAANKLNSDAGSSTKAIYFSGGKPVQCNSTIAHDITGNAATATKATQDGNGNTISSTYLPLSGGTMTGQIKSSHSTGGMWISGRDTATIRNTVSTSGSSFAPIVSSKTQLGSWDLGPCHPNEHFYFSYATDTNYNAGTNSTTTTVYIKNNGVIMGAAWNDYAEFRICKDNFKPGQVVCENNDDTLSISTYRLQPGANIVSDTFGFAIGETDEAKCPIAVSGRVLAYTYESREEFNAGDAVCAGPNGTVSKMTREEIREYPERIIGTVSAVPDYETWGTGNVSVNGRIWIKVV